MSDLLDKALADFAAEQNIDMALLTYNFHLQRAINLAHERPQDRSDTTVKSALEKATAAWNILVSRFPAGSENLPLEEPGIAFQMKWEPARVFPDDLKEGSQAGQEEDRGSVGEGRKRRPKRRPGRKPKEQNADLRGILEGASAVLGGDDEAGGESGGPRTRS